jgi:hypothetical protein
MSLELQTEEEKRKTAELNDALIDMKTLLKVTQQVLSTESRSTKEFTELCAYWHKLRNDSNTALELFSTMIPSNVEKFEAE